MRINKLIIATDACCIFPDAHKQGRAGKGKSACGVIFISEEKTKDNIIADIGKYLGEMTVPEAEYHGLILALECASEHCRNDLEIWLDSELVVRHLNGDYKLKAENLKPLFDKVKSLEGRYNSVNYFHHHRDNEIAKLADLKARSYQVQAR